MGFPDRLPHSHVHGNFALLLAAEERPAIDRHGTPEEGEKAAVKRVLDCLGVAADQFAVGFTKVFFKAGVLPGLRKRKAAADRSRAVTIQKFARRRLACTARKRLRVAREQREYLRREAERAEAEAEAARRAAEEAAQLPVATGAPPVPGRSGTAGEGGDGGGAGGKPLGLNLGNLSGHLGGSGAAKAGHAGRAPPLKLQRQGSDLRLDSEELHRGLLSHRGGGGGGFAPLLSHRAPDRREVNKVAGLKQKTSQWLELVLEYAAYLGMDAEQDEELMWIAEQALRAPVPDGWEELMDPLGNLYFYNEGTMQTTRQHPMDGYYQSLYRKLRLQRTQGGGRPPSVPGGASRRSSTLSSRSSTLSGASSTAAVATKRGGGGKGTAGLSSSRRSSSTSGMLSSRRGGSRPKPGPGPAARTGAVARGGGEEPDDLGEGSSYSATPRTTGGGGYQQSVSISAAMEMATPRTAAFMLERFGLSPDAGEDERCLMVNPAFYLGPSEGDIQRMTGDAPTEADKPHRAHGVGGASGRFSRRSSPSKAAPFGSRRLSSPYAASSAATATPPRPTAAIAGADAGGAGIERGFVECHLDKEELGMGMQSYTLSIGLHDGHEALALTAAKRVANGNTQYQLGIVEDDGEEDLHPFTGKLSCDPKATNFVLYDDVNEALTLTLALALTLALTQP